MGIEKYKALYYRQAAKNVAKAKSDFMQDGAGDLLARMME